MSHTALLFVGAVDCIVGEEENMKRRTLEALFAVWDAPMVRACLQGTMGEVVTWGANSALAAVGDFCYLAGEPVPELIGRCSAPILVPCSEGWTERIEAALGERAVPFTRYATRHEPENFNYRKLFAFTTAVPKEFSMIPVDKDVYFALMEREWSRDLCGCFKDAEDFLKRGLGFVITMGGGIPVAGATSYAACRGAIEIEIDTRPDVRKQGLATACGAKLILECLKRGLYPGWDAHDSRSLALAEKLGYRLDRPYTAFWVEEWTRG